MAAASISRVAAPNFGRTQQFMGRLMSDFSATMTIMAGGIGDRLGLFTALADGGPQTAEELAGHTGYDPALVCSWLQVVAAALYVDYDADSGRFRLPPEHAVLADREPMSGLAGGLQLILGLVKPVESLILAFRTHTGVPQSLFDQDLRAGMERMSAPWFQTDLVDTWIPAVEGLPERLHNGAAVADIGCGRGRALIRMAQCFPSSEFTGFDFFPPVLEEARRNATEAKVDTRIRFAPCDVTQGLPGTFDVITLFNSLHDVTPAAMGLRAARCALRPGGLCLLLEGALSDELRDNLHPLGAVLYGTGFLYNTPVFIANGGTGPGPLPGAGLAEGRVRSLCAEAGLQVRRVPLPNPMHALYVATA